MDIDSKLEAYRSRKKREKKIEKTKEVLYGLAKLQFLQKGQQKLTDDISMTMVEHTEFNEDNNELESSVSTDPADGEQKKIFERLLRVNNFLYLLLWISLFIIAIEFEFGIVFFTSSMLFFIWFNTRTGPKKAGEVSAYSVFNPNCEAIHGTINAEQFERELRYGAISVQ